MSRSGGPATHDDGAEAPSLRIVNSDATPEEIAALVAVLSSFDSTPLPAAPRSTWAAYGRRTRPALRPGPGSWRASGLPR